MVTISPEVRDWLLEETDPGPRYLALRDLFPTAQNEIDAARTDAHRHGPIAQILAAMHPDGYWVKPGGGYNPKYRSAVWSLMALSQCGASADEDPRIRTACSYYLDHALAEGGQISHNGAPSGTIDCIQGNILTSFVDMGLRDERLDKAYDWMARTVTGEGIAPNTEKNASVRYYAYKCGPLFRCGPNNKLPCAWGGTKVLVAFCRLPEEKRTPVIRRAIDATVDFFFGVDPVTADYPCGYAPKPSANWWKFGFPVFYVTDILQIAEGLVSLGYGKDPRLENTLAFIREQGGEKGIWSNGYNYAKKTWVDWGPNRQPSKWVTVRALRTLLAAEKA